MLHQHLTLNEHCCNNCSPLSDKSYAPCTKYKVIPTKLLNNDLTYLLLTLQISAQIVVVLFMFCFTTFNFNAKTEGTRSLAGSMQLLFEIHSNNPRRQIFTLNQTK